MKSKLDFNKNILLYKIKMRRLLQRLHGFDQISLNTNVLSKANGLSLGLTVRWKQCVRITDETITESRVPSSQYFVFIVMTVNPVVCYYRCSKAACRGGHFGFMKNFPSRSRSVFDGSSVGDYIAGYQALQQIYDLRAL